MPGLPSPNEINYSSESLAISFVERKNTFSKAMLAATGVLDGWLDKNASEFHDALATSDVERVLMLAEDRKTPKKVNICFSMVTTD